MPARKQPEKVDTVLVKEKVKGKVEQLVRRATGSKETQRCGKLDEAKRKAREQVADVRTEVKAAFGPRKQH
jgi:uncharacterized protein YjbJ (UPF0337 family)